MDYKTILAPWLIQRGKFRDIPEDQIAGLDSLIQYDYMGSSEFEFGALPKSLKSTTSNWDAYIHFQIDSIKDNDGEFLQVICNKTQAVEIREVIINLFNDKEYKIRLKERTGMQDYLACTSKYALDTNFWWDVTGNDYMDTGIQNSWMCCFGISNIRKLILAVRKVWCKHNSLDVFREHGPDLPALSGKPRLTLEIVHEDRTRIEVTTLNGRKTIINKRAVQSVIVQPNKLEVTVKNKAGVDRILCIVMEPSNQRKMLENMLNEQVKFNNYRNKQN